MQLRNKNEAELRLTDAVEEASSGGRYDLKHRSTEYSYDDEEKTLYITIGPDNRGICRLWKKEVETLRQHGFHVAGAAQIEPDRLRVWFYFARIK